MPGGDGEDTAVVVEGAGHIVDCVADDDDVFWFDGSVFRSCKVFDGDGRQVRAMGLRVRGGVAPCVDLEMIGVEPGAGELDRAGFGVVAREDSDRVDCVAADGRVDEVVGAGEGAGDRILGCMMLESRVIVAAHVVDVDLVRYNAVASEHLRDDDGVEAASE